MAEMNGVTKYEDTISVAASHLGKRKRTASPDPSSSPAKTKNSPVQAALQDALLILRKHDTTPSVLKYPLPSSNSEAPDTKKARLTNGDSANETIEDRILAGTYSSLHALKEDVDRARVAITHSLSPAMQNGKTTSSTPSETTPEVQEQLSKLVNILATLNDDVSAIPQSGGDDISTTGLVDQPPRQQVIALRSQVNGVAQMLFSNLQAPQREDEDGTKLLAEPENSGMPNGFELADFNGLGGDGLATKPEKRLFSSIFRQAGRVKPLEQPHAARDVVRGNTLEFISPSSRPQNLPPNKNDYKYARLPAGLWLSYGSGDLNPRDRKQVPRASSTGNIKAAVVANDVRQGSEANSDALFRSAYSSFAPSTDNSFSLIPGKEKGRQWWHKFGDQTLSRFFTTQEDRSEEATTAGDGQDEFAELVANFEPIESEDDAKPENDEKEAEDLLEEVSDMLETLSSYQRNRSLETIAAGSVPKPTQPEIDVFGMLRNQLNVLVSALPPYAVAKLNGDQLEELNISTTMLVEVPDYPGSGLPDEYTLRRQKMTQQATSAAGRTGAAPPVRPSYPQSQGTPMAYNSQARSYNASVPATAAYGMRAPPNYQTPPTVARPAYAQNPYQNSSTPFSSRPTAQQFQRPLQQNGYGNYTASPGQPQTPAYGQRPTQPGYPPRVPDGSLVNAARSASPQKLLVNGQQYPPRQYGSQQPQTPFPFQRQNSGPMSATPGAGTVAAGGYGRYDGSGEAAKSNTAGPSPSPGPGPGQAAAQSPVVAQSVEVSR